MAGEGSETEPLRFVRVPAAMTPAFLEAERYVADYFSERIEAPEQGLLEINGQRYILVRAASMSIHFYEEVRTFLGTILDDESTIRVAQEVLFDLAHAIGRADARDFHVRTHVSDPIERLATGPIHFAHTGWAVVQILEESHVSSGDDCMLLYDHPYSFEAAAWLKEGRQSGSPVCVMNAGYSSGWCTESFGVNLVSAEVLCRARGDDRCRFVMAPPHMILQRVAEYRVGSALPLADPPPHVTGERRLARLAAAELERDRVSASLRESERLQETFLDNAPFGAYFYEVRGEDLILTGVNPAALAMTEIELQPLFGLPIEEAFPYLGPQLRSVFRSVAQSGEPWYHQAWELPVPELGTMHLEMYAFQTGPGRIAVIYTDVTERLQQERELRESERRLQAFLDHSPFGAYFVELQSDGRLVLTGANPAADRITGFDNARLLGEDIREAFPPLEDTELPELYPQIARGERGPYHNPRVPFSGLGLEGMFDVHVFSPGPERVAVLFRDVTEQARAEEAERASQRLEATATLAGGIAHDVNNLMGGVVSNVAFLQRSDPNRVPAELETLNQISFSAHRASELADQLLAYARGGKYQIRPVDLGAVVREVSRLKSPTIPDDVRLETALESNLDAISADPTQIRQLVRYLLDNAIEAVSGAGRITLRAESMWIDTKAARSLQLQEGRFVRLSVEDTGEGMSEEVLSRVFEPYFSTKAAGRGMGLAAAYGLVKNHGGGITVESRPGQGASFQVYLPVQETHGSFSVAELARSELRPPRGSLEGVGSLALGVVHDFNNLLTVALNSVTELQRELPGSGQAQVESIRGAVLKCRALSERLLTLGRTGLPAQAEISLNDICREVAVLLRSALEPQVELELALWPDLPQAQGTSAQLENALLNLCFNSRDAMSAEGHLTLSTGVVGPGDLPAGLASGRYVFARVADDGVGMSADVLERARQPFFTTKSAEQGTGLGLAMADRVVSLHGGQLDIVTASGEGTTVTMYLPLASGEEAPKAPRSGRLLVVDDAEHVARSTAQLLRFEGFEVEIAPSGEVALERFELGPDEFALVILDVVLPGISGNTVFRKIRELNPTQPIVVCSGFGQQSQVRELVQQGAVFLAKPFMFEQLLASLDEAMR